MINVEISKLEKSVVLACDAGGAKRLIEILELYIERNIQDHDHLCSEDGLTYEKMSKDPHGICANDVTLYYFPDGVPENN